jgi:hypothetical protein
MNAKWITGNLVAAGCLAAFACTACAQDSVQPSVDASRASVAAAGTMIEGSAELLRAGATFVVAGVTSAADASIVVFRSAPDGSVVSLRITGNIVQATSLAVGSTVEVLTEAAGTSLVAFGHVVAFIPNEVGRALVYSARSTQSSRGTP